MNKTAENAFSEREFPMTDGQFSKIQKLAYEQTGINLSSHKKNMIYSRLSRRLRSLDLSNFGEYLDLLENDYETEKTSFINSITTNLTSFFRENHHFVHLRSEVIPRLLTKNIKTKRIRIWSAGCSTGEEPYSISMVLSSFPSLRNWDVKVLATDLDSDVVAKSDTGVYDMDRVEKIPREYMEYLQIDKSQELVKIKPSVKQLVTFKQLNLLHEWPMKGPFDVIFCRNVVIYFDADTQRKLFDRYADILRDNHTLFIGHSENLAKISTRFKPCGRTIYEKIS